MRAIILSGNSQLSRSPGATWGVLTPLVDRPFLQHLVESIIGHGIREIDFVLPDVDQAARAMLGDGTRWGAQFKYHAAAGPVNDSRKKIAANKPEEMFFLAHSDRLPLIQLDVKNCAPTLFCWRDTDLHWTGWGVVRTADMLRLPAGLETAQLFTCLFENGSPMGCEEGKKPLSAKSYEDLIESNRRVLSREFPCLMVGGKEVQPGVWVSRNAKVHPTAKLRSPAFLGENCRVGAMVEVGPAVSIGKYCMIERDTFVSDSVVFNGSYVGQNLALKGVVVDRSRLINTRWDAEIEGVDELLLGSVFGAPLSTRLLQLVGRLAAVLAVVLFSPLLLVMFVASLLGWIPALVQEMVVETPTVSDAYRWKMFPLWSFGSRQVPEDRWGWLQDCVFRFLPGLLSVAAGQMAFTGSAPRTKDQAVRATMAQNFSFLYTHPGLIQDGLFANEEMQNDALSFETVDNNWRETVTLLLRYGRRMFWTAPASSSIANCCRAATGGVRREN